MVQRLQDGKLHKFRESGWRKLCTNCLLTNCVGRIIIEIRAGQDCSRRAQKLKGADFSAPGVGAVDFAGGVAHDVDVGDASVGAHGVDGDEVGGPQAREGVVLGAGGVVDVKSNHYAVSFSLGL